MTEPQELVSFLYILLRDLLPSGVVERILREHVDKAHGKRCTFSDVLLEQKAREIARHLVPEARKQTGRKGLK